MPPIPRAARFAVLLIAALVLCQPAQANDNHLAYRLLRDGKPAQAAELFSDPAWKGVALYRAEQWWRAAQAFVRANNADALYNLGNVYVRLGYHALALESYLATLQMEPGHADAQFNANLVRQFLAKRETQKGQAGVTPRAREIDRLKKETERKEGTRSESGNDPGNENARADNTESNQDRQRQQQDEQAGGDGGNRNGSDQRLQADAPINNVQGRSSDRAMQNDNHTAGGSRNMRDAKADPTAGKRVRLEQAQATEQWLNGIQDNPAAFLKRRIAQEMARRRAAGTLPESSEQPW